MDGCFEVMLYVFVSIISLGSYILFAPFNNIQLLARLAQSAERQSHNLEVVSSILTLSNYVLPA